MDTPMVVQSALSTREQSIAGLGTTIIQRLAVPEFMKLSASLDRRRSLWLNLMIKGALAPGFEMSPLLWSLTTLRHW